MGFWDIRVECFIIQGQHLDIMLQDIYILMRLLMLGVIGDTSPNLSHGETLDDLCERNYYATPYVHESYILICDIETLLT